MNTYNNPFYFALPLRSKTSPADAEAHIAETFKVTGRVEHVHSNGFRLFRIVGGK